MSDKTADQIRQSVRQAYAGVAQASNEGSCCGEASSCCGVAARAEDSVAIVKAAANNEAAVR